MKQPNIYKFVGQNDVSASQHTIYLSHSFPAKKLMSSDFMAAGIIYSGFRSYMLDLRIVTVIKLSLLVGFTLVRVGRTHFP